MGFTGKICPTGAVNTGEAPNDSNVLAVKKKKKLERHRNQ
jgi:hypothetical protein